MSTKSTPPLVNAIIQGWQEYQQQLVTIVKSLTPEQLAVQVGPDLRPVNGIIAHIIEGRASWFCEILKEGYAEVAAMSEWDAPNAPARSIAEYVHGLEATWTLMQNAIESWTEEQLTEQIVLPWLPEHPITRPWVVWHLLEHDLHHGGEISHSLGSVGLKIELPPPPPRD